MRKYLDFYNYYYNHNKQDFDLKDSRYLIIFYSFLLIRYVAIITINPPIIVIIVGIS